MILSTVMLAIITSIFGCYVFRFYGYVTSRVIVRNTCRGIHLVKSSRLHLSSIMRELLRRVNKSFSWCDVPLPQLDLIEDSFMTEDLWDTDRYFDAEDGHDSNTELDQDEYFDSFLDVPFAEPAHAFASVLATSDEDNLGENTMSSFDTDSSFWVCDNSATGHICNDASMFHGELIPSVYGVATASGTSNSLKMGTVILWLRDDEGVEHTFTLKECIYMPSSPVNILSTRRLSEHYPDGSGNPDTRGTGITSFYTHHELFWNGRKFVKTFPTASSGLPECLFNTGFSRLGTYATRIARFYDDSISWAFTSKSKDKLEEGEAIDMKARNVISFLKGMTLILNDGDGTKKVVVFDGVDFIDGMQVKCKVTAQDGTTMTVDPEVLHFIENPDIASIPQTSEEYS